MGHLKLKALLLKLEKKNSETTGLEDILRDFYRRMSQDILTDFFFTGKDPDQVALKQAQFLRFAAGLSPRYSGKKPVNAHLNLPPILSGHFDRRLVLLRETLQDHGLEESDIRTWVEFEKAFRDQIISKYPK